VRLGLGQTDVQTDGRIAVSLNAPLRRGHNNRTGMPVIAESPGAPKSVGADGNLETVPVIAAANQC